MQSDELADAITQSLRDYSEGLMDGVKAAAKKASKTAIKEAKERAPKKSGEYASGWTSKVQHESSDDIRIVVHNKKKPQLTHLSENGHSKQNGGRVEGTPHIQPAEQAAKEEFEKAVEEAAHATQ